MFEVKIFTTKDKSEWLRLLDNPNCQDPHYVPHYLEIYEDMDKGEPQKQFGGEGFLFVYGDNNNYILYPFIKRPIVQSKEIGSRLLYDISAPYGYGGPLACIQNSKFSAELWPNFYHSFRQYCQENGIVAEFARLNPILENHKDISFYSNGVVHKRGKIIYFDLTLPLETIIKNMSENRRKNIKIATSDTKYEFGSAFEIKYASTFYKLYTTTMKRNEAETKYFFSRRYFEKVFKTLGSYCYFDYVNYKDITRSACLCLSFGKNAYLFLQASNLTSSSTYANIFLVYNTLIRLKNLGFNTFVLGGGVSASEDSLYDYKYRFSKLTKESYVYNNIHINEAYERLVELRKSHGEDLSPDYFPQYRSPSLSR